MRGLVETVVMLSTVLPLCVRRTFWHALIGGLDSVSYFHLIHYVPHSFRAAPADISPPLLLYANRFDPMCGDGHKNFSPLKTFENVCVAPAFTGNREADETRNNIHSRLNRKID